MADTNDTPIKVEFLSEFNEVKSRKTASLDKQYTVKLQTGDPRAILLDNFSSDSYLKVTVEVAE